MLARVQIYVTTNRNYHRSCHSTGQMYVYRSTYVYINKEERFSQVCKERFRSAAIELHDVVVQEEFLHVRGSLHVASNCAAAHTKDLRCLTHAHVARLHVEDPPDSACVMMDDDECSAHLPMIVILLASQSQSLSLCVKKSTAHMLTFTCSIFFTACACNVLRSITQQQSVSQPLQTHCVFQWGSDVERKSRLLPSPAAQKGFSQCKNVEDDWLCHTMQMPQIHFHCLLGLKNTLMMQTKRWPELLSLVVAFTNTTHFYFCFLFEEREQILHRGEQNSVREIGRQTPD